MIKSRAFRFNVLLSHGSGSNVIRLILRRARVLVRGVVVNVVDIFSQLLGGLWLHLLLRNDNGLACNSSRSYHVVVRYLLMHAVVVGQNSLDVKFGAGSRGAL